jgi:hypothetical protein
VEGPNGSHGTPGIGGSTPRGYPGCFGLVRSTESNLWPIDLRWRDLTVWRGLGAARGPTAPQGVVCEVSQPAKELQIITTVV